MSGRDRTPTAPTAGPGRGTKARAARAATSGPGRSTRAAPTADAGVGPATPPASGGSRGSAGSGVAADPDRLTALKEQRDFLLRSLRDLEAEHDAADVDDTDYEALKDDYTARAAAVIRAIDDDQVVDAPASRPWGRRLLVAGLVVVFAVAAGLLVARSSGERGAGDTITGGIRGDTRDELLAARQDAAQGQYLPAIKQYDKVLQQDPANTEALAYKGWMLRLVSLQAQGQQRRQLQAEALASLQQALRTNPRDATSLVFTAALLGDLGQPKAALADLDQVAPGQLPDFMSGTIDQLRTGLESQLGSTSTSTSTP